MPNKLKVFLSYASEDAAVVGVLEQAIEQLRERVSQEFDIYYDKRDNDVGDDIDQKILSALQTTDILLIVYTEALKKSHSYTGQELGAFKTFAFTEGANAMRRIVPLYLHEPPAGEANRLGIRLDIDNLDNARPELIDPDKGLLNFFNELLSMVTAQKFPLGEGLSAQDQERRDTDKAKFRDPVKNDIKNTIVPQLLRGLVKELSSRVASRSIEQNFLQLIWKKKKDSDEERKGDANIKRGDDAHKAAKHPTGAEVESVDGDDIMAGCELKFEKPGTSEVLGITAKTSMRWEKFIEFLNKEQPSEAPFILNALRDAVVSGFSAGPVDNEQFFLSPSRSLYRVIVTRHYTYYDGSRHMHMYFIPMLSRFEKGDISIVLALLNVTTRYRLSFLDSSTADLTVRSFEFLKGAPDEFKIRVRQLMRQLDLIDEESHVYKLDKRDNFDKYYGNELPADHVAQLFLKWKEKTGALRYLAAQIESEKPLPESGQVGEADRSKERESLFQRWITELRSFDEYIEPLNQRFGVRAAERLVGYFGGPPCYVDPKSGRLCLRTRSGDIPLTVADAQDKPVLDAILKDAVDQETKIMASVDNATQRG
jgi:TIR domain